MISAFWLLWIPIAFTAGSLIGGLWKYHQTMAWHYGLLLQAIEACDVRASMAEFLEKLHALDDRKAIESEGAK